MKWPWARGHREVFERARTLRDDTALARHFAGLWYDEGEVEPMRREWLKTWDRIPHNKSFHAACRARLARAVPLGSGAARLRRESGVEQLATLVYDPEDPDHVQVALSPLIPSLLWVRCPFTPQGVLDALGPYLVADAPAFHAYPRCLRLMLGYPMESLEPIVDAIKSIEHWVDDGGWGSAFDDDPWPDRAGLDVFQRAAMLEDCGAQHPSRLAAVAFRTLWSRSLLRIERHSSGNIVFEMRYAPVADSGAVATILKIHGYGPGLLPPDLPLDLCASLLRGPHGGIEGASPETDAINVPGDAMFWAAVEHAEPAADLVLRRAATQWADDPASLVHVAQFALERGHLATLYEIALTTNNAALRTNIRAALKLHPLPTREARS